MLRRVRECRFVLSRCARTIASSALAVCASGAVSASQAQTTAPLRFGAKLSADSVKVGDPFTLTVTVEVPSGAKVTWPTPADSNGPIGLREPVKVSSSGVRASGLISDSFRVSRPAAGVPFARETATYSLVAWGIGSVPIALPDIKVDVNGTAMSVPFNVPPVFVVSVLPGDTSMRVPKPAKALFPRIIPWWELWWPVLLVLLVLALLAWLVMRRKKRRELHVVLNPFARAERDFDRLDKLALAEAGEQGRYVALALEVLRTYLSARIAPATLALTSDELLSVVAPDSRVPVQQLAPLLSEADAIKFGQSPVDSAQARTFAAEARTVVSSIEQAEVARQAAQRAQRKEDSKKQQQLQKQMQKEAEDEARVQSRRKKSEAA